MCTITVLLLAFLYSMIKMDVTTEKLQLSFLHLLIAFQLLNMVILPLETKILLFLDVFHLYGNLASYITQSLQLIEDLKYLQEGLNKNVAC